MGKTNYEPSQGSQMSCHLIGDSFASLFVVDPFLPLFLEGAAAAPVPHKPAFFVQPRCVRDLQMTLSHARTWIRSRACSTQRSCRKCFETSPTWAQSTLHNDCFPPRVKSQLKFNITTTITTALWLQYLTITYACTFWISADMFTFK